MERRKRKLLSTILVYALILIMLPVAGLVGKPAMKVKAEEVITRAEWLQDLAETFEMSVEDDNYPDNYFSDLDSSSEYYYDVLLNVEFGVIDVPAGGEVMPDEPVTREFAAQTLNYCLGYQLDEEATYTFSDVNACQYPDDMQIALNRGWFTLVDKNVQPALNITTAEATAMLADAEAVLSGDVITEQGGDYEFADDVVIITNYCEVDTADDGTVTVSVKDLKQSITKDTRFAVYQNLIPVVYVADTVKKSGSVTTITATVDQSGTAYTEAEAQGVINGSIAYVEALDGTEVIYIDEETGDEYNSAAEVAALYGARSSKMYTTTISVKKELDLDGAEMEVQLKIKNARISYDLSVWNGSAKAILEGDVETKVSVKSKTSYAKKIGLKEVRLVNWVVPGVGGFVVTLDAELEGSVSSVWKGDLKIGLDAGINNGFRIIKSFKAKTFTMVMQLEGKIGLTAKLGLTEMPILKGYVYATTGGKATVKTIEHSVGYVPDKCIDFSAHIYASYGVEAKLKALGLDFKYKLENKIFDENNSPIRIYRHYENGMEVATCTASLLGEDSGSSGGGSGSESKPKKYYTPTNSSWGGSGWSEGKLSAGYNNDGTQIPAFEYKLNSDGDGAIITKYGGSATSIAIPEYIDGYPVVGIGSGVFQNKTKLVSVFIPDSVKSIGTHAFSGCAKMSTVNLPKNLEAIGYSAFLNCTELRSINIPKSLGNVDTSSYGAYGPFGKCKNLKTVEFEEGIARIPASLFEDCTGLEEIIIPNTVTSIGYQAFSHCENLQKVNISDSVTSIERNAFYRCEKLSAVNLPNNLVTMGHDAFANCTDICSINIPKSLGNVDTSSYGAYGPFGKCKNLKTVEFEEGITRIPASLFEDCTGLEEIIIPNTVTSIGYQAFSHCENLQKVNISDSVTSIERNAFYKCEKLSTVDLPNNLVTMGHDAFANCTDICSINIPKSLGNVDTSAYGAYGPFANCNNLKTVEFEEGITRIPASLFEDCTGLDEIMIPNTVISIGYEAFNKCENLQKVNISDSVTSIERNAFSNCSNLQSVEMPDSVTSIGSYAFRNCSSLVSAKLSEQLVEIGYEAFAGSGLTTIVIPNSVTSMGSNTFQNCTNLKSVTLPSECVNIVSHMFAGCTSLESITLPSKVETIQQYAFADCTSLKSINWNSVVHTIKNNAFQNCDALTAVTIPDTVTSFGTYVFKDCDALTDVKLGNNITSIPQNTFEHCDVLATIQLPYRVASIGSNAFKDCVKLAEITIPRATTTIDSAAFSYPDRLTIYGVSGTYAETFAKANNIKFVNKTVAATKATLSQTSVTLNKGQTTQIVLQVSPANFTDEVAWKSGDTNVATVDAAGNIKAVGSGSTVIKVTVGNVSVSCKVTVHQPVTSISLNRTSLSLEGEGSFQLTAAVYPTDANNKEISWSSSDEKVATVDNAGLVKAVAKGTAIITVMTKDGSEIKKTCEVTVTNNVYRVSKATELESPHNYADSCSDSWIYQKSGAQLLKVTFDKNTNIEDGFDYLYLYDAEGAQVGKYTGTQLAGKTIEVTGDTVRIKLVSDASGNTWGFKVTDIKAIESTPTPTPTPNPGSTETPDLSGLFATSADGNFVKDGTEVRCYNLDGTPVINEFKCDGTYTYYFQADGTAMRDRLTYHPDGVHVIYFDENGHEVFSNFANVKKTIAGLDVDDYCFFDVYGYLYVDVVTYDKSGTYLYYANPYGVMDRGKWFEFSESVKWADGTPFDKAGGKYGYANEDGTLMINQWTYDWEGRQCYMQGNGVALYP